MLASQLVISYYIGYFGQVRPAHPRRPRALRRRPHRRDERPQSGPHHTANGVAVITFIIAGAVEWRLLLLMMIACAVGGYNRRAQLPPHQRPHPAPIIIVLGFVIAIYFFIHKKGL